MSNAGRKEAVFPIRVVAEKTGINPVTLRAWERRHGLIHPQRTAKGHRLYSEQDVHNIARIVALLEQGIAISRVGEILAEPDTGEGTVTAAAEHHVANGGRAGTWETYTRRMATAVSNFDERALDASYNDALSLWPAELVVRQLLEPLLHELEARWQNLPYADTERHFLHAYLRNKLGARLQHLSPQPDGPKLVLAGVPGEHGETAMLILALAMASAGIRVVLLGGDCQIDSLAHAVQRAQAAGLVLHADLLLPERMVGQIQRLQERVSRPVFMAGGCTVSQRQGLEAGGLPVLERDPDSAAQTLHRML